MIVVLTNIPTPYRTNFFNRFHQQLSARSSALHVLYCASTEPNRNWSFSSKENNYPFTILTGFHPRILSAYPHINFSVIKALKRLNPSKVIVAGAWNTPTMLLAILHLKIKKTKTIFWSEGHADSVTYKKGIIPFIRKCVYNLFDAYAVPNLKSEHYVTNYIGVKDKPFLRLPNTVDVDFFYRNNGRGREYLKSKYGFNGKRILIQVSQLENKKGVLELVNAWNRIVKNLKSEWVLLLVGEGSLKGQLQQLKTTCDFHDIRIFGHAEVDVVRDLLHASDVFILATKKDPNPLTPIEAAFSQLPILISSKAGNASEIVKEGLNGYLIEHIDENSIAQVISRILSLNFKELETMGKESQRIVEASFHTETVVANFIDDVEHL